MSGAIYLLDTNIILGILKETDAAIKLVETIPFEDCCYSAVTRMELLGFPQLFKVLSSIRILVGYGLSFQKVRIG